MFEKILIANRGEIACRIIKTCRRMGVRTVAVYSDADRSARHVRLADEAIWIGASPARESYLDGAKLIEAAVKTEAQAIHPGYGFLSENEGFAEACAEAGLVFIGPPVEAIRAMGSKSAAKAKMREAGVPLTPGYHGDNQEASFLHAQADAIGYPVLIKASAGGGGKGMRRVDESHEFQAALESCRREASASFGDDRVLIERYILEPRHVEVQIFGDSFGQVVSLFERDCSVQRRHQKVLEEAPAPGMHAALRAAMSKAACDAGRAVGYVGAGTIEFLLDRDGSFHFMEMNTRLQVEHPVTEMITGLDLVEWQLRIGSGERLPKSQEELSLRGHSIEARLYAEDPAQEFLPSTGKITHLRMPAESAYVRVDSGIEQGDTITPFYDPMIAKLIVWDETRALALGRMRQALGAIQILGVTSNVEFLRRLVTSESFSDAVLDTSLIERESAWLQRQEDALPARGAILAVLAKLLHEQLDDASSGGDAHSPWGARDGWRMNLVATRSFVLAERAGECRVQVRYAGASERSNAYDFTLAGERFAVTGKLVGESEVRATFNGHSLWADVVWSAENCTVFMRDGTLQRFVLRDPLAPRVKSDVSENSLTAPMPGRVVALLVGKGEDVSAGTPLLVLEAMKMEFTVKAPADGKVEEFLFTAGEQVGDGAELLRFERKPA